MRQSVGAFAGLLDRITSGDIVKSLHVGDSLTVADLSVTGGADPDWVESLTGWVRAQANSTRYSADRVAVSGRSSRVLLSRYDADVLSLEPDHINLGILTNDLREVNGISVSESADNVRQIIEKTLSAGIVMTIWGVPPRYKENKSVNGERRQSLGVILAELCAEYNIPYVDTRSEFQKIYRSNGYNIDYISDDQSHYGQRGNDILAGIMFKEWFQYENLTVNETYNKISFLSSAWWQRLDVDAKLVDLGDFAVVELDARKSLHTVIYNEGAPRKIKLMIMASNADGLVFRIENEHVNRKPDWYQLQRMDLAEPSLIAVHTDFELLPGPNLIEVRTGAVPVQLHSIESYVAG